MPARLSDSIIGTVILRWLHSPILSPVQIAAVQAEKWEMLIEKTVNWLNNNGMCNGYESHGGYCQYQHRGIQMLTGGKKITITWQNNDTINDNH